MRCDCWFPRLALEMLRCFIIILIELIYLCWSVQQTQIPNIIMAHEEEEVDDERGMRMRQFLTKEIYIVGSRMLLNATIATIFNFYCDRVVFCLSSVSSSLSPENLINPSPVSPMHRGSRGLMNEFHVTSESFIHLNLTNNSWIPSDSPYLFFMFTRRLNEQQGTNSLPRWAATSEDCRFFCHRDPSQIHFADYIAMGMDNIIA